MTASTTASMSSLRISLFMLQIFFFIIICVNSFTPSIQSPSVTYEVGSRRQLVSMNLLPHKDNNTGAKKITINNNMLDSVVDDIWTDDNKTNSEQQQLNSLQKIDANTPQIITIEDEDDSSLDSTKWILISGTILILAAAGVLAVTMGNDLGLDLELGQLIKDPSTSFDTIITALQTMDVQKGCIYFSSFYVLAEILAIPAVPILTASSGYLFGTVLGTATCLFSASIAASISFVIGRTFLRGYVEKVLKDKPTFQNLDKAISKEGFKLMLLLRLSPLFPFALSNYLYGASSINFWPYFFGTALGFAPGTFAYVYAGRIGKALTIDSASSEPWYVYVGGLAIVVALLKVAGDVASGVIDSMDEDGDWKGDSIGKEDDIEGI